ncbi:ABC transporter permease [Candidatus Aerophobetes bacterium]|uniref:ABC transporter permease n=1 Tax=Aerophobetes bacterium TaxID=2030807 RepID=A0A523QMH8_UNCAE|nr:MAG: ABC transporter permease [Candidatus Aerophobetes bacterium]
MSDSKLRFVRSFFGYRFFSIFLVFVALLLFFGFFSPHYRFTSLANIKILLGSGSEFSIIALGVGLLMVSGEFDLSVGSILVFCSFMFIRLFEIGMNLFLAGFITLGLGALLGFLNGFITTKARIPSFITTLGTMMLWRGVTLILSLGYTRPFDTEVSPLLGSILTGKIGGVIPAQAIWFGAFGLVLGLVLHLHKFGNWIYATGDNKQAARAMGINTDRVKTICFMIVGVLCAFVGVMQLLRIESYAATQGLGFELKAIASSVVGGTFLMGGVGSIAGIFLGTLTIQILENGLILMRVPVFGVSAFIGVAIILFVILNTYMGRKIIR